MKKILVIIFILVKGISYSNAQNIDNATRLNSILNKIYNIYGVRLNTLPKVKLSEAQLNVAEADIKGGKIIIENSIFACRFNRTKIDTALAFVLGHELAHFYMHQNNQSNVTTTSFACYSNFDNSNENIEQQCDVMGGFLAYLAGYKINDVLPSFIDSLYKNYPLDETKMKCYPSLAERKRTAEVVQKKVNRLIQIYEAGNYMLALNKPSYAAECYKEVLKEYQGAEMYNNLGVSYLYQALYSQEDGNYKGDWIYPIQINTASKLGKVNSSRGISKSEKKYVDSAMVYFKKALTLNDTLPSAKINLICAYLLLNDAQKAQEQLNKTNITTEAKTLLQGLVYAEKKDSSQAKIAWKRVQNGFWHDVALQNVKIVNKETSAENRAECFNDFDPTNNNEYQDISNYEINERNAINVGNHFQLKIDTTNNPSFGFYENDILRFKLLIHHDKNLPSLSIQEGVDCPRVGFDNNSQLLLRINRTKTFYKFDAEGHLLLWGQYK